MGEACPGLLAPPYCDVRAVHRSYRLAGLSSRGSKGPVNQRGQSPAAALRGADVRRADQRADAPPCSQRAVTRMLTSIGWRWPAAPTRRKSHPEDRAAMESSCRSTMTHSVHPASTRVMCTTVHRIAVRTYVHIGWRGPPPSRGSSALAAGLRGDESGVVCRASAGPSSDHLSLNGGYRSVTSKNA